MKYIFWVPIIQGYVHSTHLLLPNVGVLVSRYRLFFSNLDLSMDENNETVVCYVRSVFTVLLSFVRQRNYHKSCLIYHAAFCTNPQVSTNTGILSRKIHLRIVSPEAFILGGDEYHIDRGSKISLVCVIENAPTPPQ